MAGEAGGGGDGPRPRILTELLDAETYQAVRLWLRGPGRAACEWDATFRRWAANATRLEMAVPGAIHEALVDVATSVFGEAVKPSYSFLSLYGDQGICPLHVDRPQCKWTLDYCVEQTYPWPIYVEESPYLLGPNEALAYSGTDQPHYRDQIEPGNTCNLIFFHFVPVDFDGPLL